MARRRRRSSSTIKLNHTSLGLGFVIIGGMYFFAYFFASQSPLIGRFHKGAFVAFGQAGTMIFFAITVLAGILFLTRGHLVRTITKQYILLLMLISGILNFPILDGQSNDYGQFGGFLSWPLLRGLKQMLGANPTAIKIMVIFFFLCLVAWVVYSFNIKVPKVNISLPERAERPDKPVKEKPQSSHAPQWGMLSNLFKHDAPAPSHTDHNHSPAIAPSNSLFKDILKGTVKQKLDSKLKDATPMVLPSFPKDKPTFDVGLLKSDPMTPDRVDQVALMERAHAFQSKLMEFDVPVRIEWFNIGPTVIQIKIKLEAGVKVASLENLKNDLSLSLRTKSLRIISPIPGTDFIGIEIPNPTPQTVRLGDVLRSPEFRKSLATSQTNLAIGQGIDGSYIVKSLDEMPHLLVAGATGSGKSIGVNDFILSLMYQNTPEELKFLMVDPKQVELEFYSGLPYMLAPVVVKPENALKILNRSVEEMETRYALLRDKRVKNLSEYNEKFPEHKLFRIVIVIDELADLMMTGNKKDCENAITRIAQKARAVGIHLIVATQRPSVNVITGLIKANIPTRIAFGVVSQIDSRTVIDVKGAEDLVGKGDLLYTDPKTKTPLRVQAPYISTEETERVVESLKERYMQDLSESDIYHKDIMALLEGRTSGGLQMAGSSSGGDDEEIIEQAIQIIAESRKASTTLLQRKLNLGFARAARIMDELEERGIIWPQDGAKPRDIYL